MQIPKDLLNEKNYEGTRLIELNDPQVIKLNDERVKRLKEKEPILEEMEKLSPPLDAFYARLKPVEEERAKIKEEMQPAYDAYMKEVEKVDKVQQKVDAVNMKLIPLVNSLVKPQLGEFETAKDLSIKDGKIYVEVIDEIEEKIKQLRARK